MKIENFTKIVAQDIKDFDEIFKRELRTNTSLFNIVTGYILKTKGKQLRPTLVFLSARLIGNITPLAHSAAFMIELMHTATLLHDDVVDNAIRRRSFFSVNALWKNKISVLVGDYFLAKGLLHALERGQHKNLEIISKAVRDISEGELIQIERAREVKNSEEVYFEIITKKTASLFVASMLTGAHSTGNLNTVDEEKIRRMAELMGIAFQIKDDLLDYSNSSLTGKPTWNDLKEHKMTLPLLYALSKVDTKQQKHIKALLKNHKNNTKKLQEIVNFVYQHKGIEYTVSKMEEFCAEAKSICLTFPENEAQTAICSLIDYIGERKK